MYNDVLPVIGILFSGSSIFYLLLGVIIGLLVGALPGVGPTQAMALVLPLTIAMEPANAIILLLATASASSQGGAVTAILLNTPGDAGNAASTFDGYQMTKRGEGAKALGAAATAGVVGSFIGIIILIAILPAGRWLVLQFSYADYFALAVFGLALVASLATASMLRGLASGIAGLLAATIGMSPMTGEGRYALGTNFLLDGLNLVAVLIGIFAIAEGFRLMSSDAALASVDRARLPGALAQTLAGVRSVFTHWRVAVRSSIVGTLVGIVPGVGGVVSNFLAYGLAAKKAEKKSSNSLTGATDRGFGNGDVRGVIAPEASNNGKEGGALLPTLIFGIPGSVSMALLLAALTVHGIAAGPRMMIDAPREVLLLIMVGVLANSLASLFSFSLIPVVGQMGKLPSKVLGVLLVMIGVSSAFISESGRAGDSWVALAFGLVGLLMSIGGYATITFVIGFVLGPLMERSLFQTLQVSGGQAFVTRPISLVLLLASAALMLLLAIGSFRKWRTNRRATQTSDVPETVDQTRFTETLAIETDGHPLVDVFFGGLFLFFLLGSIGAEDSFTRLLPQSYAAAGLVMVSLANWKRLAKVISDRNPKAVAIGSASQLEYIIGPDQAPGAVLDRTQTVAATEIISDVQFIEAAIHPGAIESDEEDVALDWRRILVGVGGGVLFAVLISNGVQSWICAFVATALTAIAVRQRWKHSIIAALCMSAAVYALTRYVLGVPI